MREHEAAMQKQQGALMSVGAANVLTGAYYASTTTLRENLELQIKHARERLDDLEDTMKRMEASGLLDARIDDLRKAMQF